jgi:hypothetical protein
MLKHIVVAIVVLSRLLAPIPVAAVGSVPDSPLLIIEVQSRSSAVQNAADEEFVELCNVSEDPVDLSVWKLEYKSATGVTWASKATLSGVLLEGDCYLLASNGYLAEVADESFAPGLADSAGHVRIVTADVVTAAITQDVLGWGATANAAEGAAPAASLTVGKSLQRKVNDTGIYIDSDNNAADFALNAVPTPESTYEVPPEPETPPEEAPPTEEQSPEPEPEQPEVPVPPTPEAVETPPLAALQITELLPNPAAPATDSEDEFVELYNPNDESIDLSGYKIQTGSKFSYSYTFTTGDSIPARGYFIVTSGTTNLSLANTAGAARLLGPDGVVVAEIVAYDEAPEGQAWAIMEGSWQWTTSPTPLAVNQLTLPILAVKKTTVAKTTAKAKTASKIAAAPKAKAATTKANTAKSSKKTTDETTAAVLGDSDEPAPLHPNIIMGVSLLAVLYAVYEYRHDAANRLYQLRSYWAAKRALRNSATE